MTVMWLSNFNTYSIGARAMAKTTAEPLTVRQEKLADFCWGFICDEELTPLDCEMRAACHLSAVNLGWELAALERLGVIDRKEVDGVRIVWRVRLPDGRSANMDLIERGAA